jgi:hypothetical protein
MKRATTIILIMLVCFTAIAQTQYLLHIGSKRIPLSNNNTLHVNDIQPDSIWLEKEGVYMSQLFVIIQPEKAEAKVVINSSNKIEKHVWESVLANKIKRIAIIQYRDTKTKRIFPIAINIKILWQ